MFVLISYDIPNDRRRGKLADTLLDYGTRIQYSVFEFNLSEGQLKELLAKIRKLHKPELDSIRCYRMCEACRGKIEVFGTTPVTEDPVLYLV
jgi:CRISPR-associated protein Cas2